MSSRPSRATGRLESGVEQLGADAVRMRWGVVTDTDPVTVELGGAGIPFTEMKVIGSVAVDDVVICLQRGKSLVVLGEQGPTGSPGAIPIVTSLPGSPSDGDTCVFTDSLSAPTYRWQLVYNASSSSAYKWEVIGGSEMYAAADPQRSSASATYVAPATDPMSITTPLAGDYDVTIEGQHQAGTSGFTTYHSYTAASGATQAQMDAWANRMFPGNTNSAPSGVKTTRQLNLPASTVIAERIRSDTGTCLVRSRRLRAMPVRVG